jgi:uncharacterized protein (TIGR02646 family)
MLPITKLTEPQGLRNYKIAPERLKASPYADFCYNGARFFELREQLLREQKYVCAYCGQKLLIVENENGVAKMKTEHFTPQNDKIENDLNYRNLLGCCLGGQNMKGECYCDSKKGETPLLYVQNPSILSNRDRTIRYKVSVKSEEVLILSSDTNKDNELNKVLNLNHQYLQSRRFQIWKNEIHRQLGEKWTVVRAEQIRQAYFDTPNGQHKEFKDFVLWYLDDWLSKNR